MLNTTRLLSTISATIVTGFANGASVAPTSQVHASAMLSLLTYVIEVAWNDIKITWK
jgi:hypothetical protein